MAKATQGSRLAHILSLRHTHTRVALPQAALSRRHPKFPCHLIHPREKCLMHSHTCADLNLQTFSLVHNHTHSRTHITHTHTHTHTHPLTHTHTHTLSHSHTHTQTHTHTHHHHPSQMI